MSLDVLPNFAVGELIVGFSPEVTVREDVEILRKSSFFKGTQIVGLVQDTQTGLLKEVVGI